MRRLVLIVVVGVTVAACSFTDSAPDPTASIPVAAGGADRREVAPASTEPERSDPVAAAITFVASTDDLMGHSPIGRREILRRLVAPANVPEQAAAFEQAASDLAVKLGVP